MILRELIERVNKQKRRKERIKTAQRFISKMGAVAAVAAIGATTGLLLAPKSGKETREDFKKKAVNAVGIIKDTIQKKTETVKDATTSAAQDACDLIKGVHQKKETVKKEIKSGIDEMKKDINETAKDISNEINRPVR